MNARPIFILGAHKSGTSLIRALLDGHPDLFAVPIESHFFPLMKRWVAYPFQRTVPRKISREDFINDATAWVERSNQSRWRFADNAATNMFDVEEFGNYLREGLASCSGPGESPRVYFDEYLRALYHAIHGQELEGHTRVVEKSVENAEFAPELARLYPHAQFVHIVRNPYAVITAYRQSRGGERYPWLGRIYTALHDTLYHLDRNRRAMANYHVLRYEDLVSCPEDGIASLCNDLELAFTEDLLRPTQLGKPWGGNSSSGRSFAGISEARRDRWSEEINALEAEIVNRHLRPFASELGYQKFDHPGSVYRPCPGEYPREYSANRLLLLTGWRP